MHSLNEDYFVLKVPDSFFVYTDEQIPDGKPVKTDVTVRYKEAEPYGLFSRFPMVIFDGALLSNSILDFTILSEDIPNVSLLKAEIEVAGEIRNYFKIHFNKLSSVIDMEESVVSNSGEILSSISKFVICKQKLNEIPESERGIMMMSECPSVILFSKEFVERVIEYNKEMFDEDTISEREFSFIPLSELTFGV